jgi:hypothetical protein
MPGIDPIATKGRERGASPLPAQRRHEKHGPGRAPSKWDRAERGPETPWAHRRPLPVEWGQGLGRLLASSTHLGRVSGVRFSRPLNLTTRFSTCRVAWDIGENALKMPGGPEGAPDRAPFRQQKLPTNSGEEPSSGTLPASSHGENYHGALSRGHVVFARRKNSRMTYEKFF